MSIENRSLIKRAGFALAAFLVLSIAVLPVLNGRVSALGAQVQTRSIKLSTSASGASAVYDVAFTLASSYSLKGIIVDFCAGTSTPIIGDNCTAPTGFSLSASPTITQNTASVNVGSWTVASLNSDRTLSISDTTGTSVTSTSTVDFTINTVTNPTTSGTFFARVMTYSTASISGYTAGGGEGSIQDFGGFALSVNNQINITAKVQETLTFCVSGADLSGASNNTCASATTPTLILGHGTPVATLDNTQVDRATAYTQVSTNASQGAIIRMRNHNTCTNGGLSSNGGTTCNINGMPTGSPAGSVAQVLTAGTTAFGMYVSGGTTTSGILTSAGTYDPDPNYYDSSHTNEGTGDLWYGMDQDNTSGVGTTYGDVIASTANAPCSQMNDHLVFAATAGLTVPAGVYTATMDVIATGTF